MPDALCKWCSSADGHSNSCYETHFAVLHAEALEKWSTGLDDTPDLRRPSRIMNQYGYHVEVPAGPYSPTNVLPALEMVGATMTEAQVATALRLAEDTYAHWRKIGQPVLEPVHFVGRNPVYATDQVFGVWRRFSFMHGDHRINTYGGGWRYRVASLADEVGVDSERVLGDIIAGRLPAVVDREFYRPEADGDLGYWIGAIEAKAYGHWVNGVEYVAVAA